MTREAFSWVSRRGVRSELRGASDQLAVDWTRAERVATTSSSCLARVIAVYRSLRCRSLPASVRGRGGVISCIHIYV